jgi:hypothetical protein
VRGASASQQRLRYESSLLPLPLLPLPLPLLLPLLPLLLLLLPRRGLFSISE